MPCANEIPVIVAAGVAAGLDPLRLILIGDAHFAITQGADLPACVAFDAFGKLLFPEVPSFRERSLLKLLDIGELVDVGFRRNLLSEKMVVLAGSVDVADGALGKEGIADALAGDAEDDHVLSLNLAFLDEDDNGFDVATLGDDGRLAEGGDLFPDEEGGEVGIAVPIPDEAPDLVRGGDEDRAGGLGEAAVLVSDDDLDLAGGE
jgi:hypothetical protein